MCSLAKAVRRANPVMTSVIALSSVFFITTTPAEAGCTLSGSTVTCTANLPSLIGYDDTSGATSLIVSSITSATRQIGLQRSGALAGSGTDGVEIYTCTISGTKSGSGTNAAGCTIDNLAVKPTCSSTNGDQGQTATCEKTVVTQVSGGPSGKAGPNVTVLVNAPTSGPFTIGATRPGVAVFGTSSGSNGGNGGSSCCFKDGGDGGAGVNGGTVLVNFTGVIPDGNYDGIVASSYGGNGGDGGHGGKVSGSGGKGGMGGYGGTAAVSFNAGSITTSGLGKIGVLALSRGGNGGNGGDGGWFVSEGGSGNNAGQAGTAQVTTLAGTTINTSGDYGFGIAAYSIGGGGGTGAGGFGLFYSGGGGGSSGGNGGIASIDSSSVITTTGQYAHGILAESIGGGGGNAGSTSGLVALGGGGGAGGQGGFVTVRNAGQIVTMGLGANAIEAQSIGGGGGNGSNSGGLVSFGGDGSGTTTGGNVTVTNTAVLNTYSSNAFGILAQSIGGGGGNGGSSGGWFSYGGSGGSGADGGVVTVTNSGDIVTGLGTDAVSSPGIVAQSIGGGGGNGGGAVSAGPGFAAAFGGRGSMGGAGAAVNVLRDNTDASLATAYTITTLGDASSAIIAQSIGGGGNGGFAVAASGGNAFSVALGVGGNGGPGNRADVVTVQTKGDLTTSGGSSDGILAQSIGGGGGNGGFSVAASVSMGASVSLSIGGSGASGGDASTVNVSSLSDITTQGGSSYGILAQSLGGGGGNGGFSVAGSGGVTAVSIGIGGNGGAGGISGIVDVTGVGDVATYGNNAGGIAAQSIGGGGGNGGFTATGSLGLASAGVSVGGSGSTGGHAGVVTIDNSGTVYTAGDNAIGILAQSLGGGGGNGGFAASASISVGGSASVGVGGSGGGGQYADAVSIYADGGANSLTVSGYSGSWNLVTAGENSAGIQAQSIGGGGGNGGFAGTLSLAAGTTIGLSLGGSGGGGSYASDVLVQSTANNIFTMGENSAGIVAQSIGGGGGNGGFAVSLTGSFQGGSSAAVTLGGKGGAGGYAQQAEADSVGNITTLGAGSDGILVQSIGGGGGSGGFSVALSAATQGYTGAVAIGGSGGAGNNGGSATLDSTGIITTYGDQSNGLIAQSIGGGGGNGGFAGSGALTLSGVGVAVGLGGSGAGGGNASTVDLTNNGAITTHGKESSAIIAQSIGGGGGNGGSTVGLSLSALGGAAVTIGGSAGDGGNADSVVVHSTGNLATSGGSTADSPDMGSYGILAQSLGGGGGNGGFAGSLSVGGAVGLGVSVGGQGGGGGNADTVAVTSTGGISTVAANSGGILAQSVGGGGGNGGFAIAVGASATIEDIGAAGAVAVGGWGGHAGFASDATVTSTGVVFTQGFNSDGVAAQSIGGGGGNGGFSVAGAATLGQAGIDVSIGGFGAGGGNAAKASVYSYATGYQVTPAANITTIETIGEQSNGILAQSLGGGGGNGGFSVGLSAAADGAAIGVSVGGFGAGGGSSDAVTVSSYNNILTMGFQSNAIAAQSIGGGGGNGGFSAQAALGSDFAGAVSVGGFALGGGGDAGSVALDSHGLLTTLGDESNGILAQSVGGGGGNGGFALSGSFTTGSAGLNASIGGFGSHGGNGDNVTVASYSLATAAVPAGITIQTDGVESNGILAQSIGGGGGNGGFALGASLATNGSAFGVSVGGFGAGGGSAGDVDVTTTNNIFTHGFESNAIAAQSLGGGGGNGGFAVEATAGSEMSGSIAVGGFALSGGGNAGTVTLASLGSLQTQGDESNGILAQSVGGGGGNGGFALSGTFTMGDAGLSASLGGFGSNGGAAGNVIVSSNAGTTLSGNTATIYTSGDSANGIEAQSIGGGGGNGGFSGGFTATAGAKASMSLSVGGFGAAGNKAGSVNVTTIDNILTSGEGSIGILAQSVGGGGGNGGFSFAGTLAIPDGNSLSLAASLGGFGGTGGNASTVTVSSTGAFSTSGAEAHGLVAQSIGGGGGNGGISVAGTFNFASQNNVPSITAAVGGMGGAGGAGSDVDVTRVGSIVTTGDKSVGIMAQSVGGGGGNGGIAVSGSLGGPDVKQVTASVGGFGGPGSEAGSVTVRNTGAITTGSITMTQIQIAKPGREFITAPVEIGYASHGILAQSIGGGGGNGGFAFSGSVGPVGENTSVQVGLTVGGFGGSGGAAGKVDVGSNGLVTTFGAGANGIIAQSIGGGGGNGGSALTGLLAGGDPQSGGRSVQLAVSVGGMGGDGNVAGNVVVDQTGGIVTHGDDSNGILAQSIGGGGGTGGGANSLSFQLATSCTFTIPKAPQIGSCEAPKKSSVSAQVDVGGFGGTGNDAGTVDVTNHSFITTSGRTSSGIVAQSIGGGGGDGGHAVVGLGEMFEGASYIDIGTTVVTLPNGLAGVTTAFGKITVGGFGGAAGDGKAVTVTNEGVIQTTGESAYGIRAQSVGGGGGSGGNAASGVTGALSVGGFGAASGKGDTVTVNNKAGADILTSGVFSAAIFAQSIGGGGGDGGAAGGIIAMGGFGGASGGGGTVEVDNAAALQTSGVFADGILAQSIGGGGGNGGGTGLSGIAVGGPAGVLGSTGDGGAVTVRNSATGTILTTDFFAHGIEAQSIGGGGGKGGGSTLAAAVTVGGLGGSAGNGGHVQVFNDGQIETRGWFSIGIIAESVGGGGGNGGGSNIAAVNVGGFGGSSGNGGQVDVSNTKLVHTIGFGSGAIRALSVGGGGGSGGGVDDTLTSGSLSIGVAVDVGGGGGAAGNGGVVNVTNSGTLYTEGDVAEGILAQSIGGGGGDGGRSIGIEAIGGYGGAAGDGGAVTVNNAVGGVIWTKGMLSNGIMAQSVGGGGGNGGGAYSGSPVGYSNSVGGWGAGGGAGGSVTITNDALIQTDGLASTAIFAQSVGGGGGNGGIAGSYNVQTISGGLPAVGVSVGGSGGIGGNGGVVTVTNNTTGSIVTNGIYSTAIFAQSVGGGGGKGGFAMTGSTSLIGSVAVSVGGSSGAGGNGDAVTVTNAGTIVINGKNSVGIVAQSVGGGGGIAADSMGVATVPVTIGGQSGANGTGGDVTVVNTGSIIINGNNSIGIFAQSIGGGGGMVLPGGGASAVEKASGGSGSGGTVTIDNNAGSIVINGENSIAMYLQSVGGGGGAVGLDADPPGQIGAFLFSGTSGGSGAALPTTINQTGNLVATGLNSIALVAQSSAAGGQGDITVNVLNPASGHSLIVGGLGQGAGVEILDGADNVLNNAGVIGTSPAITGTVTGYSADDGTFTVTGGTAPTVSGAGGYAIMVGGGTSHIINNTGVIMGSVDLGPGVNAFNNAAGAYFDAGAAVILGAGNALTNAGALAPGGFQNVSATAITGNLVQTATGSNGLDLNLWGGATDQVTVSGTANLSGVVHTNLVNPLVAPGYALPGTHTPLIFTATGGVTHPNLTLQAFDTAVATYSLIYPDAQHVDLQYVIDYTPSGLTANQWAMGNRVNGIQTAQASPAFRPIATNLFYLPDVATLGAAYDSLSGEGEAATQQVSFDDNAQFMAMVGTQARDWMSDSPRPQDHIWRLWLAPYDNTAVYGGNSATGSAKVSRSAYGIGGGVDAQITPNALIGVALSGGASYFKVPGRATKGSLDSFHSGLYGAWHEEDYYATGVFSYDVFHNVESRQAVIPGVTLPSPLFVDGPYRVPGYTENPSGAFSSTSFSGHLEAGYHTSFDGLQVTPFAGLEFGSLNMDGFTEVNGHMPSVIGLSYAGRTVVSLPSLLGVQLDTNFDLGNGEVLSAWVRSTWKHEFDINRTTMSSFISAPGFEFSVHGAQPSRDSALTDLGVRLDLGNSLAVYGNFSGQFGGKSSGYAGSAGVSLKL